MHEELIRKIVRYKLNAAEKILDVLPMEASGRIRKLGRIIYESIGTHPGQAGDDSQQTAKAPGNMKNVRID